MFFLWEIKHPKLTKSAFEFDSAEINCAGKSIPLGKTVLGGLDTYKFILPLNNNSCVKVEVAKENKGTYIETTIKSKGYNMLDCDSTSSFKLERAIKMTIFKTLE